MGLEIYDPAKRSVQLQDLIDESAKTQKNEGELYEETMYAALENVYKKKIELNKREQEERVKRETEVAEAILKKGLLLSEEEAEKKRKLREDDEKKAYAQRKEVLEAELKAQKDLSEKEKDERMAQLEAEHQKKLEYIEAETKKQLEDGKKLYEIESERAKKLAQFEKDKKKTEENAKALSDAFTQKGLTLKERTSKLKDAFVFTPTEGEQARSGASIIKSLGTVSKALGDYAAQLNDQIEKIAGMQSNIDTRLQGSKNDRFMGSYWMSIERTMKNTAGLSPWLKQEDIVQNIESLVDTGIAYNIEQRAFLATMSKKIANTFNVADSSLLRLVRLQQKDSTAARLGMESAITAFLNNMYENTEYLKGVADSVRASLLEAESLMTDVSAVEFEYQMQKWMGSLFSVGMKQEAVNSIASTIGKIAGGDITGVNSGGTSNLIIMAANRANLSVADALANGLDASQTNILMRAVVDYLAELYEEAHGSKVIQQQFGQVFGVAASDLKAAVNLIDDGMATLNNIAGNNLTYEGAIAQLSNMAGSMYRRTSFGETMGTALSNLKYTMANSIADNPALYGLYKTAGILKNLTGGIDFSIPLVLGSGTAQTFNVAEIMQAGTLMGGIIDGIAGMFGTAGSQASGKGILKALGINTNVSTVARGQGTGLLTSGVTVSSSGYQGNQNSGDVLNKTMTDQTDSTKSQVAEAKESESSDVPNKTINDSILKIKAILDSVTNGGLAFNVKMQDYGLSWSR